MSIDAAQLYVACLAIPATEVRSFEQWLASRHIPDLASVGFCRISSYRCPASEFQIVTFYEFSDADIFDSASYRRVREVDPQFRSSTAKVARRLKATYELCWRYPEATPYRGIDAKFMAAWLYDGELDPAALSSRMLTQLDRAWPMYRARIWRRTGAHPEFVDAAAAQWLVCVESDKAPVLDYAIEETVSTSTNLDTARFRSYSGERFACA